MFILPCLALCSQVVVHYANLECILLHRELICDAQFRLVESAVNHFLTMTTKVGTDGSSGHLDSLLPFHALCITTPRVALTLCSSAHRKVVNTK